MEVVDDWRETPCPAGWLAEDAFGFTAAGNTGGKFVVAYTLTGVGEVVFAAGMPPVTALIGIEGDRCGTGCPAGGPLPGGPPWMKLVLEPGRI